MKKRGLPSAKGLDALLGVLKKEAPPNDIPQDGALIDLEIAHIQAGKYQPRQKMSQGGLEELAQSIKRHGLMQPIVVRPILQGRMHPQITHEIIAGERRFRAAKMANLTHIRAIERSLSDELAIALALIENIQREDLSALEQAAALERFATEFGMSHAMIADVVGKSRAAVSNLLRLNRLHDDVKQHLEQGDLDMGHARALLSLATGEQPQAAADIIKEGMTVREAERHVKRTSNPKKPLAPNYLQEVKTALEGTLGVKARLTSNRLELVLEDESKAQALLSILNELKLKR